MKNRILTHDDWMTPEPIKENIILKYGLMFGLFTVEEYMQGKVKFFDPCPFQHDFINDWNGLDIDWQPLNFVNPPYNKKNKKTLTSKEEFIEKAVQQFEKGNRSINLIPNSTSSKLYHKVIKRYATYIDFVEGRIPFIGKIKDNYINWHLASREMYDKYVPDGAKHVKNSGQFDSMIVIF